MCQLPATFQNGIIVRPSSEFGNYFQGLASRVRVATVIVFLTFLISGARPGTLGAQDLYFVPFSQAAQLEKDIKNARDAAKSSQGICWSYSLAWLDQAMSQKTSPAKNIKSSYLVKDGGTSRINMLRLEQGTGEFRERYNRYNSLFDGIRELYPEYEQDKSVRMSARIALVTMNQPLGDGYWRKIEPDLCREYDFSGKDQAAAVKDINTVLKSSTPTFLLVNLRYDDGGHTVAAIGEKGAVVLFDPNMGEEGIKKLTETALKDWLSRVGKTIYGEEKFPTRLSIVTMTALEKN